MISMQNYLNNVKNTANINTNNTVDVNKNDTILKTKITQDTFNKENNKPDKKNLIKKGAIILGVFVAILAFIKRNKIGNFLSDLFNKKNPPQPPAPINDIPTPPKTPPQAPQELPAKGNIIETKKTEELSSIAGDNIDMPLKPLSSLSENELKEYFIKAMHNPLDDKNSVLEFLEEIDKYGACCFSDQKDKTKNLITLSKFISKYINKCNDSIDSINEILQNYINIFSKHAVKPDLNLDIYCDTGVLEGLYKRHMDIMTKDTVIKFIEAFKKIAVDKQEYNDINKLFKDDTWKDFYPKLNPEDIADIQNALNKFYKTVENLPDKL